MSPTATQEIRSVPIGKVVPAKDNPRSKVGDVSELVTSIKARGILEPLLVTPNGSKDTFMIVAGERRHSAAKKAGLTEVPAIVLEDLSDKDRREIMMIENLQREDLSTLDEARGYKQLLDDGMSQRDLAGRVGKSQSHISKRVALLGLPEAAFQQVDSGDVTLDEATHLKKLSELPAKYMTAALKETARGQDPKRIVANVLRDHANDEKVAKIKADLKKRGIKTVDIPRYGYNSKGATRRIGSGYYELNTTVDKHKDETCHAVGIEVGWDSVKEIPVCTSPARHAPNGTSKLKAKVKGESRATSSGKADPEKEKARKAKERDENRRRADFQKANEDRAAFLKTMLQEVPAADDVFTLLLVRSVSEQYGGLDVQQTLVDLSVKTSRQAAQMEFEKQVEALCVFAVTSKANLAKVAMAIVLQDLEADMPLGYSVPKPGDLKHLSDYFEVLERNGYEPAPVELELLGRATEQEASK